MTSLIVAMEPNTSPSTYVNWTDTDDRPPRTVANTRHARLKATELFLGERNALRARAEVVGTDVIPAPSTTAADTADQLVAWLFDPSIVQMLYGAEQSRRATAAHFTAAHALRLASLR